MLPIELDHETLRSLPLPGDAGVKRVLDVLNFIVARRVLPYFRIRRKADSIRLARVSERSAISRLEDFHERVSAVSLLTHSLEGWTIQVQERIFDYLAFVLPRDPRAGLAAAGEEGSEALAFAELLLRHEIEHMIYPERDEEHVILSDAEFAMDRRENDPTYYGALLDALGNDINGIKGEDYIELFHRFERDQGPGDLPSRLVDRLARTLGNAPLNLLRGAFLTTERGLRTRILAVCFADCRDQQRPLVARSESLRKLLALLAAQLERDRGEAAALLRELDRVVGTAELLRELGVGEDELEGRHADELMEPLAARLRSLAAQEEGLGAWLQTGVHKVEPEQPRPEPTPRTLKDRIEAARADTTVPRAVLEAIDKNRAAMHGHSGAKYTEFIETLLAVPWAKMAMIQVSPAEFVEGLDSSHYGLDHPKEIIADFFANLIWRYRRFSERSVSEWQRSGSAFLFVGPPGVGKTSLAISIARNLGLPYHKISLGGMRDESDLVGHGFTYEGSKPGAIVQGLIKTGVMNGVFILDEADKTERFAIAPLLEILDPEQNHLFHDKYTLTTVDIDLSNCHFILTANTLETVPAPVVDRCQVVVLSRYSVDEKIAIARRFVLPRILNQHGLAEQEIRFEPGHEEEHLRYLIQAYTNEAGVRQLEHCLRTLLLRLHRKVLLVDHDTEAGVIVTRRLIKQYLDEPPRPRRINDEDRVGEMLGLGVDVERGVGAVIPIQATRIGVASDDGDLHDGGALSMVHATGNIERVMDESRKVATTGILHCAAALGIDPNRVRDPVHLHFMGGSTRKDGPSAGAAIALALASLLAGHPLRRDVAVTGEIDTHGRITGVGGLDVKLETAISAGCKTVIVPEENLYGPGGIEHFPDALKQELQILNHHEWSQRCRASGTSQSSGFDPSRHVLQVIAVDHVVQAQEVAMIRADELAVLDEHFARDGERTAAKLAGRGGTGATCDLVVMIKDMAEFGTEHLRPLLGLHGSRFVLLVPPPALAEVSHACNGLGPQLRCQPFDAEIDDLTAVMRDLASSRSPVTTPSAVVLIGPYFALQQAGAATLAGTESEGAPVHVCANNYTRDGIKLKNVKPLLNRTFCRLDLLGPELLQRCPFVVEHEGIFVVDLGLIPEKYRLDVTRAETLLQRWLERWLTPVSTVV